MFRSSQASAEFDFDYALQMSPLLPKEQPLRTKTAFSDETITPITAKADQAFSIESAMRHPEEDMLRDPEAFIRSWSTQHVIDWMYQAGIDSNVIECFDVHDVNGNVLLDLQFEDLKELDIASFGKRHHLWNAICLLKGEDGHPSPQPTPFQDISRPCTTVTNRSPSRGRMVDETDEQRSTSPPRAKSKRRGRKASKTRDIITPAESVSIVAIEQLIPKAHKCAKGDRCAKWRKQQRELQQLQDDNAIGRFPVSPTKGGRIYVAGDPGNPDTAENMMPNVRLQPMQQAEPHLLRLQEPLRLTSELPQDSAGFPSVVASSAVLTPAQLPGFALHQDVLDHLGVRDPQDNVKQFLNFQHVQSPVEENRPPTPPLEMFPTKSIAPFPAAHNAADYYYFQEPAAIEQQQQTRPHTRADQLRCLPKLDIPRSASAGPTTNHATRTPGGMFSSQEGRRATDPDTAILSSAQPWTAATSICRSATASPGSYNKNDFYRMGTPATVMDVPINSPSNLGPISRDASQSVPPSMQYRPQLSRSTSRNEAPSWRRPSMALPSLQEGQVFTTSRSYSEDNVRAADPAKHTSVVRDFGYGPGVTHAGWMRKRKTKMLRHEWTESHYRLRGTNLTQHSTSRLSAEIKDSINVDDYSVACSSVSHNTKLTAAFKALAISKSKDEAKDVDATAFAFQLIPQAQNGERKKALLSGTAKSHHFAVKTKDDRIDWMRELMLAKAREQKGKGYEVEVNGVQA